MTCDGHMTYVGGIVCLSVTIIAANSHSMLSGEILVSAAKMSINVSEVFHLSRHGRFARELKSLLILTLSL